MILTELESYTEKQQQKRLCFRNVIGSQFETAVDNLYLLNREDEQRIELIIEEQTDGNAGSVCLKHEPEYSRFIEI